MCSLFLPETTYPLAIVVQIDGLRQVSLPLSSYV